MKILVAATVIPFVDSVDHAAAKKLASILGLSGHYAEVIKVPFVPLWNHVLDQIAAIRLIDVACTADLLIAVGAPTYHLRHPNKVVWLIRRNQVYGWEEAPDCALPGQEEQLQIRRQVEAQTRASLHEASRIFATCQPLATRLNAFDNLPCQVMHLPLLKSEGFRSDNIGDYLYLPDTGTTDAPLLALSALKHAKSKVRLVIAG